MEFHGFELLVAEFYQIARAVATDDPELDSWVNTGVVLVVPVDGGRVRFIVEKPPTGRRHDPRLYSWTPNRALVVELIARTIECRSRRWVVEEQRLLQMPTEWPEVLRKRWPGQLGCDLSIGDGWVDLLIAVQSWLEELCAEAPWRYVQEKLGGLRLAPGGLRGAVTAADEIITIAEVLSEHICDECGAPGGLHESAGWYSTRCHLHVGRAK